ncbi:MAG TPA: DUF3313 family protein [Sphingobium sp.]|nr:DUF3313 family protein [Sphingobium sp.]
MHTRPNATRCLIAIAAALSVAVPSPLLSAKLENWDGLTRVRSKRLDVVYIRPQADFRLYNKVMVDRPEIAFDSNWQKDYNRTRRSPSTRVEDQEIRRAIDGATASFSELLREAYQKEGYAVVDEPAPDVLRVSTAVINVKVTAPERMTAGRSRTYAAEAGEATLVIEARDSLSGSLLGRALDRRLAGDKGFVWNSRTTVSNRSDFEILFRSWAKLSASGLTKLKAMPAQ